MAMPRIDNYHICTLLLLVTWAGAVYWPYLWSTCWCVRTFVPAHRPPESGQTEDRLISSATRPPMKLLDCSPTRLRRYTPDVLPSRCGERPCVLRTGNAVHISAMIYLGRMRVMIKQKKSYGERLEERLVRVISTTAPLSPTHFGPAELVDICTSTVPWQTPLVSPSTAVRRIRLPQGTRGILRIAPRM